MGRHEMHGAHQLIAVQGFSFEEALSEFGRRGIQGTLDLIEAQGFSCEEAPSELGRLCW